MIRRLLSLFTRRGWVAGPELSEYLSRVDVQLDADYPSARVFARPADYPFAPVSARAVARERLGGEVIDTQEPERAS